MMRLARVAAVHPSRRTVDLVDMTSGQRYAEVPVLSGALGTDSGAWAVPSVDPAASVAQAGDMPATGRSIMAAIAFAGDKPVVVGFASPARGEVAPTEQGRAVYRHQSGAYVTIGPDGTIEARHAGGAVLRIGAETGGAVPGLPAASGGGTAHVTVSTPDATLVIKPGGEVNLTTTGTLKMTYANAELTGDIALTGKLTATVDVVAAGKSLIGHKHSGVTAGGAQTGVPV